ncbi:MAG: hypothetical protein IPK69_09665 [Phycisphaerales bacterium]|nr:MAG: hypothetical protein IPK69_09665 [Phycisphaerales bacterium]
MSAWWKGKMTRSQRGTLVPMVVDQPRASRRELYHPDEYPSWLALPRDEMFSISPPEYEIWAPPSLVQRMLLMASRHRY